MNSKGNMTAVEFLIGRWVKTGTLKAEDMFQATQMEKEQIIEAYDDGQNNPYEYSEDNDVNWYDGKRYYNETYKNTEI